MIGEPTSPDDKTDTSEVVFLVGAGVSIPTGIPAMQGMYRAFLNKAKSDITPNELKTCNFFTQKLSVAQDLEEFLLAANTIADLNHSSLASFVERSVSYKRGTILLRDYQTRLNKRIEEVVAVRKRILDFMSKTCFRFDRDKACEIFNNFVDAISKQGCPVYSTNYDFVLEHVARERRINVEDNFLQKGQRQLWNPNIHFPLGEALSLIKLHGSVTWYADEEGNVEKIYTDTDTNTVGKDVDRLVIFPTRFKDIYDQHFFALYCHFLSALSSARVLVIIGHSLRDEYLKAAILERYRKGKFQIVLVDPALPTGLPVELRPARVGTAGNVTYVPFKFEEFSDELAHLIINSSQSDLASGCARIVHHRKWKSNKIRIQGNIGGLKPGDTKSFKAIVDAYLLPNERPAYVRVWFATKYTTSEGQQNSKVSGHFLDEGKGLVGSGLTGMVQEEIPIRIKVPDYPEWIQHASKVKLHVALVQEWVKKPYQAKDHAIFTADERELTYTR